MRLKKLLTLLDSNKSKGIIEICKKDNIYDGKIINQPGFQELLNLYYFHLLDSINKDDELNHEELFKVQTEYQKLIQLFNEIIIDKDIRKKQVVEEIINNENGFIIIKCQY